MTGLADWLEIATLRLLAFYLRHSRLEKGRWRLTQLVVPWTIRLGSRLGRRVVRTRHRFRMDLDLRDFIGQVVWATGEFESHTSRLLPTLLAPGTTVVDVGANIGYFTLLAAQAVGPQGRVYAFEPVPETGAELARNIALNGFRHIVVHEQALSDRDGEAAIFLGPDSKKGISAFRPFDEQAGQVLVPTARFDRFLTEVPRVDLVKIDVEGAEMRVLAGMRGCLERYGPDIIIEVCDEYLTALGSSAAELCHYLIQLGYTMYGMDYDGLVRMAGWSPATPPLFNALFSKRERLPEVVAMKQDWHAAAVG